MYLLLMQNYFNGDRFEMEYADRYKLIFEYDGMEGELRNVLAERYSYILLLADVHRLFNLKPKVINIVTATEMKIDDDLDLIIVFDIHKDNLTILFKVVK